MHKLILEASAAVALMTMYVSAYAGSPNTPIPEPGVLELAGIGAAVAIAIALKKRRK